MKINKSTLSMAIAGLLTVPAAYAGVELDNSNAPVLFAAEQDITTTAIFQATAGDLTVNIPSIPNYTVDPNNTLFYKITLLGGALFNGTPALGCDHTAAGTAVGAVQIGGANSASVSFSIQSGMRMRADAGEATAGCDLVVSALKLSNQDTVQMSAVVRFKDGLTNTETAYKGDYVKFVTAFAMKGGPTTANVTVDVKQQSQKFTANSTVSTNTAYLGTMAYTALTAARISTTSAAGLTASMVASTFSVTISGAPIAGASNVHLNTQADCAGANVKSVAPSGSDSITFTGISATKATAGLSVCMNLDGNTSVDQGQITASFAATGQSNYTPSVSNKINLVNVQKNGTTVRVLNIPKPGGVEKAFVRLYNTSNQPINVNAQLYAQDGSLLGSGPLVDTPIPANSVVIVNSDDIGTKLGTWTTGRAWMQIDADSEQFKAVAAVRDKSGTLINLSGSARN